MASRSLSELWADEDEAEACSDEAKDTGTTDAIGSIRDDSPRGHNDWIIDNNDKGGGEGEDKEDTKKKKKEEAKAVVQPPPHLPQPEAPAVARSALISHEEHHLIPFRHQRTRPSSSSVTAAPPSQS